MLWIVVLTLSGVLVAVMAGYVSRAVVSPAGVTLPWGFALATAASVSGVVIARRGGGQAAAMAAVAGWIVGVLVLVAGGRGDDYVVASDFLGYLFLGGTTVAVLYAAVHGSHSA